MAIDANIAALFGEPPAGLDLDENNVWWSDLGLVILICVAILSVVLRHAARFVQKAGLKADDYFMILAVVRLGGLPSHRSKCYLPNPAGGVLTVLWTPVPLGRHQCLGRSR